MSNGSSSFPIEWRPSSLARGLLIALGCLAGLSIVLSAIPWFAGVLLCVVSIGRGLWLARREQRRVPCSVRFHADGLGLLIESADCSEAWYNVTVLVRGPWAALSGIGPDGRKRYLLWWPDTLPSSSRRALRLASGNWIAETAPAIATMSG